MWISVENIKGEKEVAYIEDALAKIGIEPVSVTLEGIGLKECICIEQVALLARMVEKCGVLLISSANDILISSIKNHVHDYVYSPSSVYNLSDHLSEKMNYHYSYLSSIFKAREKMTLTSYVSRVRVERAKYLITQDELSFSELSRTLSYAHFSHFSHTFKKITGMTPSEYKMKAK